MLFQQGRFLFNILKKYVEIKILLIHTEDKFMTNSP